MKRKEFIVSASASTLAVLPAIGAGGSSLLPQFQFTNGFWMNLHHALFYQMQVLETAYQASPRLSPFDRGVMHDLQNILPSHQAAWYEALTIYHRNYGRADFVFDDTLRASDEALTYAGLASAAIPNSLPVEMRKALLLAAPIYEATLWPKHRAKNAGYISRLESLLDTYGARFRTRLPQLLGTPWLNQPYRVDVTAYADRDGSYCNNADDFVHIVMSSSDADDAGPMGLDVLFHEASHSIADPFGGTIGGPIAAAAKQAGRPIPDQFWHTVLMYTPGRIAEDVFNASELRPYTMVWLTNGLFTNVWPRYYAVLQQHWQPYMDGKTDRVTALTECVKKIVSFE